MLFNRKIIFCFRWLQNGNNILNTINKMQKLRKFKHFLGIAIFGDFERFYGTSFARIIKKVPKSFEIRHLVDDAGVEPATR